MTVETVEPLGAPMRVMVAASLLLAMAGSARAIETGVSAFDASVDTLTGSATNLHQWAAMIPAIADECLFKVNRGQVQNVVLRYPDPSGTLIRAGAMMRGFPNPFLQAWKTVYEEKGPAAACGAALDLWGDDGSVFPGVLSSN